MHYTLQYNARFDGYSYYDCNLNCFGWFQPHIIETILFIRCSAFCFIAAFSHSPSLLDNSRKLAVSNCAEFNRWVHRKKRQSMKMGGWADERPKEWMGWRIHLWIDRWTDWWIDLSVDWWIDWWTDWRIDWWIDWRIDWWIDWWTDDGRMVCGMMGG